MESLDISLDRWRMIVLEKFPNARFHVAPEEFGGARTAYSDGIFVGDWDGGAEPNARLATTLRAEQ